MIALFAVSGAAATVSLPAPTEWAAPSGTPTAPGDAFAITCTGSSNAYSPVISEWNKMATPNESFTMSGIRFTSRTGSSAGSDTTVWLWADNSSGGTLRQCKIMKLDGDSTLIATVPSDVPFGMYLVWVENQNGVSTPVCLNRTESNWIGPLGNTVPPNTALNIRVFGKNLTHGHGWGTSTSTHVYLKRSGGSTFEALSVTSNSNGSDPKPNPYAVEFTLPSDLPAGNHTIYVHNGHGGAYGWGNALTLTVATPWARDSYQTSLNPSGGNDTAAIQAALTTVGARANGGTVHLNSGTFIVGPANLTIPAKVRLQGAGKSSTTMNFASSNQANLITINGDHAAIEDCTVFVGAVPPYGSIGGNGNDFRLINVCVQRGSGMIGVDWGVTPRGDRFEMSGCDLYIPLCASGADMWEHDSNFYGGDSWVEGAIQMCHGVHWTLEKNHFETTTWSDNPARADQWCKRIGSLYQFDEDCYFANNTGHQVCQPAANKGEIFLFHGGPNGWYAQVDTVNGNTVNFRTDGTVYGQSNIVVDGKAPATATEQWVSFGQIQNPDGAYLLIMDGPGKGQYRRISSHTSTSLTVDTPWRVPPTSDSVITMNYFSRSVVIYNNVVDAFPVGTAVSVANSACCIASLDAQALSFVVEGNTSYRTWTGFMVCGQLTGPSWWNECRGQSMNDIYNSGMYFQDWVNVGDYELGPRLYGNVMQDNSITIQSNQDGTRGNTPAYVNGTVAKSTALFEGNTGSGGEIGGVIGKGGIEVYRNNSITVRDNAGIIEGPVGWVMLGNTAALAGNTYSGATRTYCNHSTTGSATCSSDRTNNEVYRGNDNDVNTYWSASGAGISWWQIDLQGYYSVTATENVNNIQGYTYRVETSSDGSNWTEVARYTGYFWTGTKRDTFSATGVRYVRFSSLDPAGWFFANEFRVFSGTTNLALNQSPQDKLGTTYYDVQLSGRVGDTLSQTIDVDNFGYASNCAWSVQSVSNTWLSTSTSGTSVAPEQGTGQLTITANTSTLSAGTTWGSVTLVSSKGDTKVVGVKIMLQDAAPPSTGLKFWVKADAGVTKDSNNYVSAWADQSGNGYDVSQATSSNQPLYVASVLNGKPVIRFAGDRTANSDALDRSSISMSGATGMSILVVGKITTTEFFGTFVAYGNDNDVFHLDEYSSTTRWSGINNIPSPNSMGSSFKILETAFVDSADSVTLYEGGTSVATGTCTNSLLSSGFLTIGGAKYYFGVYNWANTALNGDIAEILIYDHALSSADRTTAVNYLKNKYAL